MIAADLIGLETPSPISSITETILLISAGEETVLSTLSGTKTVLLLPWGIEAVLESTLSNTSVFPSRGYISLRGLFIILPEASLITAARWILSMSLSITF